MKDLKDFFQRLILWKGFQGDEINWLIEMGFVLPVPSAKADCVVDWNRDPKKLEAIPHNKDDTKIVELTFVFPKSVLFFQVIIRSKMDESYEFFFVLNESIA